MVVQFFSFSVQIQMASHVPVPTPLFRSSKMFCSPRFWDLPLFPVLNFNSSPPADPTRLGTHHVNFQRPWLCRPVFYTLGLFPPVRSALLTSTFDGQRSPFPPPVDGSPIPGIGSTLSPPPKHIFPFFSCRCEKITPPQT